MKTIAIVTGTLYTGGAEAMAAQLAINIDKTNYAVKVICLGDSIDSPIEALLNEHSIDIVYLNKDLSVNIKTFFVLGKILSEVKPDVIHTHISGAIYSAPWVLFHKLKMIHTIHTTPKDEFSKKIRCGLKLMCKISKAVLVTVSLQNQKLAMEYYRLDKREIKMINNPVDIKKYYKLKDLKSDFIFINVSRQDANKNQALIIKALARIKEIRTNVKLYLVGDGNQNENLKSLAKALNIENDVIFTGIVRNVEDYLAKADAYISSSHREGLPLSILEAMAAKLPFIATKLGGVPDIVTDNGLMISDDSVEELTDVMLKVIDEPELLRLMSDNSFINVQAYDSKIMADRYCDLYEEVSN